ncbi:uncharacterized protein RHO25_007022 [Cercospora beticola]|nr:hypothetical protein RHO25_007022 [Cercospora beticola]
MPTYVFSEPDDYASFQSLLRGTQFLRDYDTLSIKCKATEAQASKNHCVKSWQSFEDPSQRGLSIPLTVRSQKGFKLKHVEVSIRWLNWEKQDAKAVKLDFRQNKKRSSVTGSANFTAPRRSTLGFSRGYSWSKQTSTAQPAFQSQERDDGLAPSEIAQRWQSFVIEFSDKKTRDEFCNDHCNFPRAGGLDARPSSLLSSASSMEPELSELSLPSPAISVPSFTFSGHTPSTMAQLPTPQISAYSPKSKAWNSEMLPLLPSPVAHDYLRVGGPKSIPRVISTSLNSPNPAALFHRKLSRTDEFRILRIARGRGTSLCCFLDHHTLASPPKYEAMSYCWGVEKASRTITSGDLEGFPISEHLWRALNRLRMPHQDRLIWIDALCINQLDVDERNQQIALMRRIYSTALRTVIWIGDLQPERPTCSRGFADEGDADLTLCVHPGLAEIEHENAVEDLRLDLQHLQKHSDTDEGADVWWRRLWCAQEVHFSKRPPSVYIGPHAVKWAHFCSLFDSASHALAPFLSLQHTVPDSFSQLVLMTGALHCSDPRDRVFALLGMAHRAAQALKPDYRKSIISIIEDACLYLIQESGTVDVLLDERITRSIYGREELHDVIPSWIPDLTCLLGMGTILDGHKNNAGLLHDQPPQIPIVGLSEAQPPLFSVDAEYDLPRTLSCRGVYFDTIERRTTVADIPLYEQSPDGSLIYNSLKERGHIIDEILNKLKYDFGEHKRQSKHGLDVNPSVGRLMLDYLLEGRRSYVEDLERRTKPPERDVVTSYERQEDDDLAYLQHESRHRDVRRDVEYVRERWRLKILRAEANERFVPERIAPALASGNVKIEQDFLVARDLGNLFAYARRTKNRYYLNTANSEAPMRRDVLNCASIAEVKRLRTQYDSQAQDLELHQYNAKCRERDFFKTKMGFLGLGPSCLQEGDEVVILLGASRPFILRKDLVSGSHYTFVGEAVVPSIMSGKWTRLEKESWTDFRIK